ncbi:hypothetical protein V6S20_14110 [Klebsiella pneumoniae]
MKGSNIRRWGAALAVVIIAGAAYWFWHDRGTSGSGAPAAGQGPQGPGGARHGRLAPRWRRCRRLPPPKKRSRAISPGWVR